MLPLKFYLLYVAGCIISINTSFSSDVSPNIKSIDIIQKRSQLIPRSILSGMLDHGPYDISIPVSRKVKPTKFLRACYYVFKNPEPQKLNGSLCTHIIGAFAIVANGVLTPSNPDDVNYYIKTTNLKKQYPALKVMLSVGGGGNGGGFSWMVGSSRNRTKFIKSAMWLLTKYNFDGLDVDWEFPVWNGASLKERPNFIFFLRDFKLANKKRIRKSQNYFLLSVAVAAPKTIIDVSYDIPGMAKYVDFINLMAYDYHDYTWYSPFTGYNSPLFNRSVEKAYFSTLNTAWSAVYWFKQGMPLSKILVGLPMYAHTYTLADPTLHGIDSPSIGFGIGSGTMTFPQVCTFLVNGGTRVFDKESEVPYAYHDKDWVSYDDYASISMKAKWVKSNGFGGVMTFDLNCDDWKGICDGKTIFPLHQIIYDILKS